MLGFALFAPLLFLVPWTGAVADRFDRRRVVAVSQFTCATLASVLTALSIAGLAEPVGVILLTFGIGIAAAFSSPSIQSLLPALVPREQLASAIALNSMTWNLARTVGPALGAVIVAGLGISVAFALNAASFLGFAVVILFVRPRPVERARSATFRSSLGLLRAKPQLLGLLAILAVASFAADPINTLAPALAHLFDQPDSRAGVIIGVFGAGAVAAAFVLSGRIVGSGRRFVVTLLVLSGGVAAFALMPTLALGLPLLFVGGFGFLATSTSATSRLQLSVADHERGRVMALWNVAFLGLRPLASLVDGALAASFGVRAAAVALQVPALVLAAVLLGRMRGRIPALIPRSADRS